jgi:hypothetical protein
VWIAMPRGSHAPRIDYAPVRMIQFTGEAFEAGIEVHERDQVPLRVYAVAKTVADCFKHRNKIGLRLAGFCSSQSASLKASLVKIRSREAHLGAPASCRLFSRSQSGASRIPLLVDRIREVCASHLQPAGCQRSQVGLALALVLSRIRAVRASLGERASAACQRSQAARLGLGRLNCASC